MNPPSSRPSDGETFRLVALGKIDASILDGVAIELPKIFDGARVVIECCHDEPGRYYDRVRRQYSAEAILAGLPASPAGTRVLVVVDQDLYVPNLMFVLGFAQRPARRAVIQLPRLREPFYGRPDNADLFRVRVLKEAVHEFGHTFDLSHCPNPQCVMYFSKTLADTDRKSQYFCESCID